MLQLQPVWLLLGESSFYTVYPQCYATGRCLCPIQINNKMPSASVALSCPIQIKFLVERGQLRLIIARVLKQRSTAFGITYHIPYKGEKRCARYYRASRGFCFCTPSLSGCSNGSSRPSAFSHTNRSSINIFKDAESMLPLFSCFSNL